VAGRTGRDNPADDRRQCRAEKGNSQHPGTPSKKEQGNLEAIQAQESDGDSLVERADRGRPSMLQKIGRSDVFIRILLVRLVAASIGSLFIPFGP
jgi:hypothetical protein